MRQFHYQKDFEYATDIAFEDVCDTVVQLMDTVCQDVPNKMN